MTFLTNDVREWERAVKDTSLLRALQEIVEEETIEHPDTASTSNNNSNNSGEDSSSGGNTSNSNSSSNNSNGYNSSSSSSGYGDCGKALHQAIVSTNSIKASDVCLLALFSMMVRWIGGDVSSVSYLSDSTL